MKNFLLAVLLIFLSAVLFTQTRNPDKPLKGQWDFQMKKLWQTQNAGDDVIGVIQNIRSAKDGRIYVVDGKSCRINIYTKGGKFISFFGTKGEGPGEIKNFMAGDQLFVVNETLMFADRSKVHYFTLDGAYNKSKIIPTYMTPRTFVSEHRYISAPAYTRTTGNKTAKIKLYDLNSQTETVIAEFRPFDKAQATQESGGSRSSVGIIIENITPLMFVQYRSGNIYYGMSSAYHIFVKDLKGKKIAGFSMPDRRRKPVSKAYKENLKRGLGDVPPDMLNKILNGLPPKASFFQGIEIDKNGLIYVFVSDPERTSAIAVDIFSPSGKYLYASEFKVEEEHTIQGIYLKDELLLLAVEDEEGNQGVVKYSIKIPSF
jgi:hypothetical protein